MVVDQCGLLSNQDMNGNIRLGYQLPLTKCVEYRTFNAIKTGSGWNATYTPTSVAVLSGKMEMSTQEFANTYNAQDEVDRIAFAIPQQKLISRHLETNWNLPRKVARRSDSGTKRFSFRRTAILL